MHMLAGCFVNPETFDCNCHATKRRFCKYGLPLFAMIYAPMVHGLLPWHLVSFLICTCGVPDRSTWSSNGFMRLLTYRCTPACTHSRMHPHTHAQKAYMHKSMHAHTCAATRTHAENIIYDTPTAGCEHVPAYLGIEYDRRSMQLTPK